MKNQANPGISSRNLRSCSNLLLIVILVRFLVSCTVKTDPFSIIEFTGVDNVSNYSKSFLLMQNMSDSIDTVPIAARLGDLLACDEYLFLYKDGSQNKFSFESNDSTVYINGKLYSIDLPNNEDMLPWFMNSAERDYSNLQFISFGSKLPESYLPYLKKLAGVKPDAGFWFDNDFAEMTKLLEIFKPKVIAGPTISRSDFDMLSKLTQLEVLMVSFEDSVISDPLPALPSLRQIFVNNMDNNTVLTNDLLINNRQIERVIISNPGDQDLAILDPLYNLKELVISGSDTIKNLDRINRHNKLEVVSVTGFETGFNPAIIKLPSLRWITFSSNVTQDEFNTFINTHPDLEIVELISNDTLNNLQALSSLTKLTGLVVTDTVTGIAAIKTLKNLKYLSLPADFLKNSVNKAEIMGSLPDTRIAANEGFCLGSGWLLFLIPLVVIIRFLVGREKHAAKEILKS